MRFLRQSTATNVTLGPFIKSTDGITPYSSLTLAALNSGSNACRSYSNGTASGWTPQSVAYDTAGMYAFGLSAADTGNIGRFKVFVSDYNNFNAVWEDYMVLPQAVFDALIGTNASPGAGYSTYTGGAVASVTGPVTVGTNNDKSGYSLAAAPPTLAQIVSGVWDEPKASHTTAGTFGLYLDAAVSSRLPASSYVAPTDPWSVSLPGSYGAGTAGKILGGNLDAAVSSRSTFAGGSVASVTAPVTVGTNNDKSGYSLTTAPPTLTQIVNGVWDEPKANHNTTGTFGYYLDARVSAISGGGVGSGTDPWTTDLSAGFYSGNQAGAIVFGMLDAKVSTRLATSGYTAPGDPWSVPLPGSYAAGTAGKIVGSNLDSAVSSRSTYAGGPVASVTAPVTVGANNDKAGYSLAGAGLDPVVVEPGINFRQAQAVILAASAGDLSGAASSTVTIQAAGHSSVNRITAPVDASGDRTGVALNLPA